MKTGFFDESAGVKSMTRLITFLGSVGVLSMAGYMIYLKSGGPVEIASFLGIGLAAVGATKVSGAMIENKKPDETTTDTPKDRTP
jgi:hypothetical protein